MLTDRVHSVAPYEYSSDVPVVFGHHWRTWEPNLGVDWTPTTACVDFSAGKGGPLVAYTWSGERVIDPSHFVSSEGSKAE